MVQGANDAAGDTVKKVLNEVHSDKDHAGDINKGFGVLNSEFQHYVDQHKGDNAAITDYWSNVQKGLKADNKDLLPELALVYGKQVGALDISKDDDGNMTKKDIERFQTSNSVKRTPMDETMSTELKNQFDQLKSKGWVSADSITQSTLNDKISDVNQDLALAHVRQADSDKIQGPLAKLFGNDGDPNHSLFHAVDAAPGFKPDGSIAPQKIDAYKSNYDYLVNELHTPEDKLPPGYSKENYSFISNLEKGWMDPRSTTHEAAVLLRGGAMGDIGLRAHPSMVINAYTIGRVTGWSPTENIYDRFKQ